MPILNADGKQIEKRYTADGTNVRTVYNADGDIVFEEIDTTEGALPQTFKSRGKPLVNYRIYGNTVQNGTPTPSDPVEVQGCGARTENLFDKNDELYDTGKYIAADGVLYSRTGSSVTNFIEIDESSDYYLSDVNGSSVQPAICFYDANQEFISGKAYAGKSSLMVTSPANCKYVRMSLRDSAFDRAMLTKGSTAPDSYIPYGYKLNITTVDALENTSVTTPVYIGQSPIYKIGDYADYVDFKRGGVVRYVKELVLTGDENWSIYSNVYFITLYYELEPTGIAAFSTHFINSLSVVSGAFYMGSRALRVSTKFLDANVDDFKAFLTSQYAAGTPVKVYYVLETPEFEPIADLAKIPTFAPQTVIDADMSVKPSKIWYKYKPQSYLEYFKSLRTGAKYQVKIPKFAYDTTTDCIKQLDNAGLVAEPSTDAVEGRDDYLDIPVFKWWHCNYRRDSKGQAIITALEGDPDYSTTGTADVGSLFMSRYRKWEEFEEYSLLTISDSPHVPEVGWELMDVCKDENGNDKGYGIFSAYHGLYSQPDIEPLLFVSYNSALTLYQQKGAGYWGQTYEKWQFVYDNILLKYATKSSQTVFAGCASYSFQYDAAYKDSTAHTYFPLTAAQASNIEVGSAVCVGYASLNTSTGALDKDRGQATVRSKVASAKVLKKETVTLDGVDYVGIYLDIPVEQAFDTLDTDVSTATYPDTYSPAMLSTMPWWSGSTDVIVGKHDGSLGSNVNNRYPFRVMGIECMIGAWEVVTDTVMYGDDNHNIQFYQAPFGVARSNNTTTIQNTYRLVGTKGDISTAVSFWIGDVTSPKGIFYPTAQGTSASVGCGDQCYYSWQSGWRERLFLGHLGSGSGAGLCSLTCGSGLAAANWFFAACD